MHDDPRMHSPAAERNKAPILDVLVQVLPPRGLVLELASGSGQHAVHFARALPSLDFQPSEIDGAALASLRAYVAEADLPNLRLPRKLDVGQGPWGISAVDAVLAINLIHIAPFTVTHALFDGAAACLRAGGPLVLYGPYRRAGAHTAPSNVAFDAALRERDPRYGVRDLEEVAELAAARGFSPPTVVPMPANNLTVVFRRIEQVHVGTAQGQSLPN
ncbi:MAG: DUF938 domain-containing protein [Myxococcota bacterium]